MTQFILLLLNTAGIEPVTFWVRGNHARQLDHHHRNTYHIVLGQCTNLKHVFEHEHLL